MLFPECPTIGIKAAIVRELHVTTSGENPLACSLGSDSKRLHHQKNFALHMKRRQLVRFPLFHTRARDPRKLRDISLIVRSLCCITASMGNRALRQSVHTFCSRRLQRPGTRGW
jgi:hypothetical protein